MKSEVGSRNSELGSRNSELGSRKLEVGTKKSEIRSPYPAFVYFIYYHSKDLIFNDFIISSKLIYILILAKLSKLAKMVKFSSQ